MLKETRFGLGGPWNVMLRSPEMSEGLLSLYNYFRWKTALPQPLVELAILTTAREWSVQFEWFAHYPLAIKAGVSPALLADLAAQQLAPRRRPVGVLERGQVDSGDPRAPPLELERPEAVEGPDVERAPAAQVVR